MEVKDDLNKTVLLLKVSRYYEVAFIR